VTHIEFCQSNKHCPHVRASGSDWEFHGQNIHSSLLIYRVRESFTEFVTEVVTHLHSSWGLDWEFHGSHLLNLWRVYRICHSYTEFMTRIQSLCDITQRLWSICRGYFQFVTHIQSLWRIYRVRDSYTQIVKHMPRVLS